MNNNASCGLVMKQIHDEISRKSNNILRPQGLTLSQVRMLLILRESPDKQYPLKDLENLLQVAQSTVAGIVLRLEQKGLIESFSDENDKRIKIVKITSKGYECCKKAELNQKKMEEEMFSNLTEDEYKTLYQLVNKVKDSMGK